MALSLGGACHYHPMRAGIGVCVECRQVICSECSTRFEGINRCAACLARMARRAQAPGKRREWSALSVASTLVIYGALLCGVLSAASLLGR